MSLVEVIPVLEGYYLCKVPLVFQPRGWRGLRHSSQFVRPSTHKLRKLCELRLVHRHKGGVSSSSAWLSHFCKNGQS